ncbi:DUF1015 family protein [Lachnospiraceae bacterium OttesenSCG-928-D06]|nr:DUF1015 family protein [Lachnospiraceae bacterium OttesenSCG-928-D06]
MADIRPFRAYRPKKGMEDKIAALPYDVYNREEAALVVAANQASFLKIDRAETQFGPEVDTYDQKVYDKAKQMLWQEIEEGIFIRDEEPCYYLYQLTMNGRSQTGIVACASIDDYLNNVIKKHENTRADKEEDRIRHVDCCDAQTGPIFLAYRNNKALNQIIQETMKEKAVYDFESEDGIGHKVYKISDSKKVTEIQQIFKTFDAVYIADGHHRCASAVKVGLKRREVRAEGEHNYFLSVLFPDEQLHIMDYNRVVADLNGLTKEEFLSKVAECFSVMDIGGQAFSPDRKGRFGMYLAGNWYVLTAKEEIQSTDAVEGLDVSILQEHLLSRVLGITNPKRDKRIDFVGGIRGLTELERRAESDMEVAFSLYPTSIEELFAVADMGRLMPPKSTWFEPKLRSGLFIHSMRED